MLNSKMVVIMSAMIDKMDIDIFEIKGASQKQVGEMLVKTLTRKLYKVENELFQLIGEYKGISVEEAAKADFIAIIKEIMANAGVAGLFS